MIVIAHILVKQGRDIRGRFEQRMRSFPEVMECLKVSGVFDYIVKVTCSDRNAYQTLSERWLNDTSLQVARIESSVVLRTAKHAGIYLVSVAETQDS